MYPYALIFDMDGVLIDSHSHNQSAISTVLSLHGMDFSTIGDPNGEDWKGSSFKDLLDHIFTSYGVCIPHDSFRSAVNKIEFASIKEQQNLSDEHLVPCLTGLQKAGYRLSVATSSGRERMHKSLQMLDLQDVFEIELAAEDVHRHKPFPDVYLKAADLMGLPIDRCIVIEDTNAGATAALRAGATVIGYSKFNTSTNMPPGVKIIIDDFSVLNTALINRITSKGVN